MLPKDKDKRVQDAYLLGNLAIKAKEYLNPWFKNKRDRLTRDMLAASNEEAALVFLRKIKLIDELEKDINKDIQTGELAIREMEEDGLA